jgi:hypothetical protein
MKKATLFSALALFVFVLVAAFSADGRIWKK